MSQSCVSPNAWSGVVIVKKKIQLSDKRLSVEEISAAF